MKYILPFFINHISFAITMQLFVEKRMNLKGTRFFISFFTTLCFLILNFEFSPVALRVIINVLIYILLAHLLFRKSLKESILIGMLVIIIGVCTETVYFLFTYPIFHYNIILEETIDMALINNIAVGAIMIILFVKTKLQKIYDIILSSFNKIKERKLILFSLLIVTIFNFGSLISFCISKDLLDKYYLNFIGSFLCLFTSILVFYYFKTQNKYLAIYEKYNISLESIRQFEIISQKYYIDSHEVNNQFRTIRNMSKNKKIISYIDALLNENTNDDEQLFTQVLQIPPGGLRGIIYTKLLAMDGKGISFELNVDKKITNDLIQSIDDYTLTAICKILGVFLDNAIDGVSALSEQYIMIELYIDNKYLNIDITNNYEGYVDIEKINTPGESTKGAGHGYGLSLVSDLINKNKKLFHESEIIEDNFMQRLKIKV